MQGLTESEATRRRAAGQGNNIEFGASRSYLDILRANLFTFVNVVLLTIGAALVALGAPEDAITTAGLVTLNVLVGVFQEARAKQKLDQIALLARPKVTLIREGKPREADPAEVVLGDLIVLNAGDQAVCDGVVVGEGRLEMDESLLTGESDAISKQAQDEIFGGSICLSGSAVYEATKVGADSLANRITTKARDFKLARTPLQNDINFVVRLVGFIALIIGGLLWIEAVRDGQPLVERVQMAAVVMGLIPQGLIFLITLSYGLGAVRIGRAGALVQQINAIESMSNVTVLCMDKTGTLTTNQIKLFALYPYKISEEDFQARLGVFTASSTARNKTSDAILSAYPAEKASITEEVTFASAHKWSGLCLQDGAYVLGAPEIIGSSLAAMDAELTVQQTVWANQGLRVVMFAHLPEGKILRDSAGAPLLPPNLQPLGLVCLSDELRPEANATLQAFTAANIKLKIISGDNPGTVAALAQQAGFDVQGGSVSGVELAKMDDEGFRKAARQAGVFGRITPDQKERLVEVLQADGEYVAMMGDGVNDVLSLKKADVGIAMQSGSTATRNVADIVLLNDSFAVLPPIFEEGQRIVNAILDTMRILLGRTTTVALIVLGAAILGEAFPFLPTHDALNSFVVAGLPPIIMALWAKSGQPHPERLARTARFIFPAALLAAPLSLFFFLYFHDQGATLNEARTATTISAILSGLSLLLFAKPPAAFWAIQEPVTGDGRYFALAIGSLLYFAAINALPPLREFFALEPLSLQTYLLVGVGALAYNVILRGVFSARLFERFLRLEGTPSHAA